LIDPEKFGGRAAFLRETTFFGDACRAAKVAEGEPPVRLPGQGALARRADQLANGVKMRREIVTSLEEWARELDVPVPVARS
jgi:L-lactate dehydrogenase